MEHYCRIKKKRVQYYFDPECRKRDYLYEYQVTHWMPFAIRIIQGRIGKKFVVKHYRRLRLKSGKYRKQKIIMTRVPDMSKIVASADQRECRNLFKEAVAFAKVIIADPVLKDTWKKRYRVPAGRVYYRAVKVYMLYLQHGIQIESELLPLHWHKDAIEQTTPIKAEITEIEEKQLPSFVVKAGDIGIVAMEKPSALRLTG